MTCRRCCEDGRLPYEIADVMSFLIDPPEPETADELPRDDDSGGDRHDFASAPPDQPIGRTRSAEASYRFAWNG